MVFGSASCHLVDIVFHVVLFVSFQDYAVSTMCC